MYITMNYIILYYIKCLKCLTPPPLLFFMKIRFLNKTKCILKWQRLDYVNSEAFGEAEQLMQVSNLIKESMVRLFQFIFLWFIGLCDLMTSTSVVLFSFVIASGETLP